MMAILAAEFAGSDTTASQVSTKTDTTTGFNTTGRTSSLSIPTNTVIGNLSMTDASGTHTPIIPIATIRDATSTVQKITDVITSTTTSTHTAKHTISSVHTSNNGARSNIADVAAKGYAGLLGAMMAIAVVL
jgi:hypothetical protein